jgi:hypothetical protein
MQTPKISLIKKNKEYLSFTNQKVKYIIGFHDNHLAHYIKDSLPANPEISMFRTKCTPVYINTQLCKFNGVKLILPKKERHIDVDMMTGYWSEDDIDDGFAVECMDIHDFINQPFQYILPYEVVESCNGQTILKCNLIEKYNT